MGMASAGTSIIGGELQGWASVLEQQNMKQAYQNELAKQQGFQQQAMNIFGKQPGMSSAAGMMAGVQQGAQNRQQAYQGAAEVPLGLGPRGQIGQQGYNPSVANSYTDMMGGLRAQDLGYGDYQVQQSINNMNTQRQLDQISNFAGGESSRVFPQEMYKQQHSLDWLSELGQAISSVGGAAANYAQYAQQPQQNRGGYYPVYTGGVTPAFWSGYGGVSNMPPAGTGYNPYTDQSMAPGIYPSGVFQ